MTASSNVGLAFGLVAAAGACTMIGGAAVFFASLARPSLLAASLGFAAGVMLYVSFAEIFMKKSLQGFVDAGYDDVEAYRYATLSFFAGFVVIALLDRLVHFIIDWMASRRDKHAPDHSSLRSSQSEIVLLATRVGSGATLSAPPTSAVVAQAVVSAAGIKDAECASRCPPSPITAVVARDDSLGATGRRGSAPAAALDEGITTFVETATLQTASRAEDVDEESPKHISPESSGADRDSNGVGGAEDGGPVPPPSTTHPPADQLMDMIRRDPHAAALERMGYLTAFAVSLHNVPEGMATFVAALSDTSVGIGIAAAIAVHNCPEGICVAMPIYYATGSKWKAFAWAAASGLSELLGALIGWLALYGDSNLSFALVFALVSGMMVYISIKELIPMALRYDPVDKWATTSVVVGMVVIAASLLLFTL